MEPQRRLEMVRRDLDRDVDSPRERDGAHAITGSQRISHFTEFAMKHDSCAA
jgi:hypothetical protein